MQRPGGAYFVNRHHNRWKEEIFSFPKHPKILKSIKNSSRKVKKCEIFSRFLQNFRNFRKHLDFETFQYDFQLKFSKLYDFQLKSSKFPQIFEIFPKIWKIFHIFSLSEMDFLWIFVFDVLERADAPC